MEVSWVDHIMSRDCLLKHVIEGKIEEGIEMMGRLRSQYNQLLDGFKEARRYWKLKEEALGRTLQRTCLGRNYGLVVKYTTK